MPGRSSSRTGKPASRRADSSAPAATAASEKLRERLLAMILRNEAARKAAKK